MSLNQNTIETAALGIDRAKAEVTSLTTKYEAMANGIARITRPTTVLCSCKLPVTTNRAKTVFAGFQRRHFPAIFPVEVQYSLKLDCSKVAQDLTEGSKSLSELLYDKAL